MKYQLKTKAMILFACAIVLSACSLPSGIQTQPTADISSTVIAARTEAAMIVLTQIAGQATATPLPPTATLAPSATTIPSATPLPSNTPTPQATATKTYIPYTLTPINSPTPQNLSCSITGSSPNSARLDAKTDFDAVWTVKNTGTDTWTKESYDYKYVSGQKMHKFNDAYDFKSSVASGDSIDIRVDMAAPADSGTYTATWAIVKSGITVCTMSVNITVK